MMVVVDELIDFLLFIKFFIVDATTQKKRETVRGLLIFSSWLW